MKLTKSNINKFIKWTSSKYNACPKNDIISEIFEGMKNGYLLQLEWKPKQIKFDYIEATSLGGKERIFRKIYKKVYSCGSYCWCSSLDSGFDYVADFKNKELIKCFLDDNGNLNRVIERINFKNNE